MPTRAIFVVGPARSGTSWLANLLAAHSEIFAVQNSTHGIYESHVLSHTQFSLEGVLPWKKFVERYWEEIYVQLAKVPLEYLMECDAPDGDVLDHFSRFMDLCADYHGCKYWLEKTPRHCSYARQLVGRFPEAQFVTTRRSPRDIVRSNLAIYGADGMPMGIALLAKIARLMLDMEGVRYVEAHASRVIQTSYERLKEDHLATVEEIWHALSLAPETFEYGFEQGTYRRKGKEGMVASGMALAAAEKVARAVEGNRLLGAATLPALRGLLVSKDKQRARSFPRVPREGSNEKV